MSKIILAKRNSAIFLATLLVLGTIATIVPSAQAQQYYEESYGSEYPSYKDNYDYKAKDSSSTIVKKIKCNNINDNLNNVDINSGLPNSNDAIAEAQAEGDDEGQATTAAANDWGNSERTDKDFRFVCINNNDNENNIVNETTPIPPEPTQLTIGTNIYLVQDRDSGNGAILNGLAICDPGDFVLNGGYILSGTLSDNTFVNQNTPLVFDIPSVASPGQAWVVTVFGLSSGTNHNLLTNAYCFDNPPAHIP